MAGFMDNPTLLWVALLVALYLYTCWRIATQARARGRSAIPWFFISLFFTSLPAVVMFVRDEMHRRRARSQAAADSGAPDNSAIAGDSPTDASCQAGREAAPQTDALAATGLFSCPHCHALISRLDLDRSGGVAVCPRCGLAIDEVDHA